MCAHRPCLSVSSWPCHGKGNQVGASLQPVFLGSLVQSRRIKSQSLIWLWQGLLGRERTGGWGSHVTDQILPFQYVCFLPCQMRVLEEKWNGGHGAGVCCSGLHTSPRHWGATSAFFLTWACSSWLCPPCGGRSRSPLCHGRLWLSARMELIHVLRVYLLLWTAVVLTPCPVSCSSVWLSPLKCNLCRMDRLLWFPSVL